MKNKQGFLPNKMNKYSIRKFTVGTASLLIGATLVFGVGSEAQAAELDAITTMLKALADSNRLQLLLLLQQCTEPLCVSEIASQTDDKITTVSNRLKQLHDAGLVNKRRDGQHILYTLQDVHVEALLSNLIAHASHV